MSCSVHFSGAPLPPDLIEPEMESEMDWQTQTDKLMRSGTFNRLSVRLRCVVIENEARFCPTSITLPPCFQNNIFPESRFLALQPRFRFESGKREAGRASVQRSL